MEDNSIQMMKDLQMFLYQLRLTAEVSVVEMVRMHHRCVDYLVFEEGNNDLVTRISFTHQLLQ